MSEILPPADSFANFKWVMRLRHYGISWREVNRRLPLDPKKSGVLILNSPIELPDIAPVSYNPLVSFWNEINKHPKACTITGLALATVFALGSIGVTAYKYAATERYHEIMRRASEELPLPIRDVPLVIPRWYTGSEVKNGLQDQFRITIPVSPELRSTLPEQQVPSALPSTGRR